MSSERRETPFRGRAVRMAVFILLAGFPLVGGAGAPAMQNAAAAPDREEVVVITLRPYGFEPAELTRSKGRILLVVNNRSGLAEMSLAFGRENNGNSHAAVVPREKKGWKERLELAPGRYRLTEANHPEWVCTMTIGNK